MQHESRTVVKCSSQAAMQGLGSYAGTLAAAASTSHRRAGCMPP